MLKRVLDSSVLIPFWNNRHLSDRAEREVVAAADELAKTYQSNVILTPIFIEFVVGARNANELRLMHLFLARFIILDEGNILAEDWRQARRIAERVPPDGKRRQLGDCLIWAIAQRLKYDVQALDVRFKG